MPVETWSSNSIRVGTWQNRGTTVTTSSISGLLLHMGLNPQRVRESYSIIFWQLLVHVLFFCKISKGAVKISGLDPLSFLPLRYYNVIGKRSLACSSSTFDFFQYEIVNNRKIKNIAPGIHFGIFLRS